VLLAVGAVDAAGYSVIAPVLPAVQRTTGASVTTVSLLAATFPLAMLAGFVPAAGLAHRGRTRPALLLGLATLLVGSLAFAATTELGAMFAARAVMGLGSGCLWIALAFRTLEYWPGHEYLGMSRIYAAYSVGALIGPALGALGGTRLPFLAYAGLLLACAPLVAALPAPIAPPRFRTDTAPLRSPGFRLAAAAIMFAIMALGILDGVLPLHFASRLSQFQIGVAYTVTALLVAVSSTAAGHARPRAALAVGGCGAVAGVALAGATGTVPAWAVALALIGLGAGAAETGATGVLLQAVPAERIVTAMVVWSQLAMIGYLLAPAVGGPLVDHLGYAWIGLLPLAAGAAVALIARTAPE